MLHRRVDNSVGVGQGELDAFVQRHRQRLLGLESPVFQHHRLEIRFVPLVVRQRLVKPPPDQRSGRPVVLEQLIVER